MSGFPQSSVLSLLLVLIYPTSACYKLIRCARSWGSVTRDPWLKGLKRENFILLTAHPAPSLPPALLCTTLAIPRFQWALFGLGTSAGVVSSASSVLYICPCVGLALLPLSACGSGVISSEKASGTHQSGSGAISVLRFITETTHRRTAPVTLFCAVPDGSGQLFGSLVSSAQNTVLNMKLFVEWMSPTCHDWSLVLFNMDSCLSSTCTVPISFCLFT